MAYLTQIDTSTLSNQNISSALLVHTFTNTTRVRQVYVAVDLAQIAGNGDYSAYVTIQRAGAGNAYPSVLTTEAVPSGVTLHTFNSIALILNATDVLKVYVVGLAGDTTTPDIATYVWEEFVNVDGSGNPTPNDSSGITTLLARIIGTLATGTHNPQSGDAYARLGAPAGASIAADIASVATNVSTTLARLGAFTGTGINTVLGFLKAAMSKAAALTPSDVGGTFDNTTDSLEAVRDRGDAAWLTSGGNGGALSLTYTLTSSVDSSAIQGATVELYAEVGMVTLIDSQVTNALGQCTFSNLVAGTYYLKRIKSGWTFGNPDTEIVS